MKGYRIAAMAVIGVLCCNTMAFAAPKPLEEAYEKNGNSYIKKTYVINNTEEIFDTMDTTFELNGLVYHQIDISSKPVIEILTKDVKQTEETTVASRNDAAVLKKLGATKQYTDEEGYQATLKAEKGSINYTVSGYTTKNQTKHGSRTYYNLSSMDFSQIPKSIWEGGVYLTLMDVKWIGDNNLASGDTAVGNTYAAVGYYTGTYSVKIPSGYRASVLYKGTAKKEISEQTAYTITYLGEESMPQQEEKLPLGFIIGGIGLALAAIGTGIYLFLRDKRNSLEEETEESEQEETKDADV